MEEREIVVSGVPSVSQSTKILERLVSSEAEKETVTEVDETVDPSEGERMETEGGVASAPPAPPWVTETVGVGERVVAVVPEIITPTS